MSPQDSDRHQTDQASWPEQAESAPGGQRTTRTVPPGLVSIVIACCGQLEYTRLCVPSLLRHTRGPYDLLFLDAGSLDGTAEYLAGVAAAAPVRVEVVRTPAEPGIAASNQGTFQARGEFIVLLSNDTIVTDQWLEHLVKLAGMDPAIGAVGAMSNYAPPAQLVAPAPYRIGPTKDTPADEMEQGAILRQIDEVDRFARQWREQQKGGWFEVEHLGGGCVLLRRQVLKAVGPSLTLSRLGFFDLEALSRRVRQAGHRLVCCRDLFIHYFGSRDFAARTSSPGPQL